MRQFVVEARINLDKGSYICQGCLVGKSVASFPAEPKLDFLVILKGKRKTYPTLLNNSRLDAVLGKAIKTRLYN
jgi:hypothetical protein